MKTYFFLLISIMATCVHAYPITYFNDGKEHTVDYYVNSDVYVQDSISDIPTIFNFVSGARTGRDFSLPGTPSYCIHVYDNSIAHVSGGKVDGNIEAFDNSYIEIYGGIFSRVISDGNSQVVIYGNNFEIDGVPVDYGRIDSSIWISQLTGFLHSGEELNTEIYNFSPNSIILIPEPCTLLLLGMGGLLIRKR